MAQAARAYRMGAAADVRPGFAEERFSASDVRAVRTGGAARQQEQPSLLPLVGFLAAIVLVVVAGLCFGRIALTNAAVTTMIESDALSTQIEQARSSGVGLEMQQSVLSSPSAINSAVKRLGMAAPAEVGLLQLSPDVVAYSSETGLSFSDSVKNVVNASESARAGVVPAGAAAADTAAQGTAYQVAGPQE